MRERVLCMHIIFDGVCTPHDSGTQSEYYKIEGSVVSTRRPRVCALSSRKRNIALYNSVKKFPQGDLIYAFSETLICALFNIQIYLSCITNNCFLILVYRLLKLQL